MRTGTMNYALGTLAALAAGVALVSQSVVAQVVQHPNTTANQTVTRDADHNKSHHTCKASEVIGMDVRGIEGDDNIGSINDLVLGRDGQVKYAAVSFGGFLGVGDKLFAVPFDAIDIVKTDDDAFARIDVTEETLKAKQGFNQDNWPEEADRSFTTSNERRQAAMPNASR